MKRLCLPALSGLVILLLLAVPSLARRPEIMRVEDVKPGMKGYGLTVFKGAKVEKFDVEVIGVLWNFFPKRHVILVKCADTGADYNQNGKKDDDILAKGGISSGMSGSPVYLARDGKDYLIGAVALGWSFGTDPVAGVTPVEHMIEDMETPLEKPYSDMKVSALPAEEDGAKDAHAEYRTRLKRLATPLVVSGLDERTFRKFADEFRGRNFRVIQGGGSGKPAADGGAKIEPGCTIGVPLVRGDIEIYMYGTLTMYDPESGELLAFGHDLMSSGECRMPLMTGTVTTVMTSLYNSFKFAGPLKEVGVLTRDRRSAVSGVVTDRKDFVSMIPLTVRTAVKKTREDGKAKYETFSMEVLDLEDMTPNIMRYCIASAITSSLPSTGDSTVFVRTKIKFKDHDEITTWDSYVNYGRIYDPGISMKILGSIMYNPHKRVSLESVDVTVDAVREFRMAMIEEVKTDAKDVKPGEEVTLKLKLKGYEKGGWWEEMKVKIPDDIKGDSLSLYVEGGATANHEAYWSILAMSGNDVRQMLDNARDLFRPHSFVATIYYDSEGIRYKGRDLKKLPPSIVRQFESVAGDDVKVKPDVKRFFKEYDWVVGGGGRVQLRIKRKEK